MKKAGANLAPGLRMAKLRFTMNNSANHGRVETPGHSNSPGVQHSSTAEIAAQQLKKLILHSDSPPFYTN